MNTEELFACLAAWESAEQTVPRNENRLPVVFPDTIGSVTPFLTESPSLSTMSDDAQDFTAAIRRAWHAAERVSEGRVPLEWLTAYLSDLSDDDVTDSVSSNAIDSATDSATVGTWRTMADWLVHATGRTLEALAQEGDERSSRLRVPQLAFTTREIDETLLPDTPVGEDGALLASLIKRDGRLLLRLQTQSAALRDQILAVVLPPTAADAYTTHATDALPDVIVDAPALIFVALAATGVGDWSVGWAQLTEAERFALQANVHLRVRAVTDSVDSADLLPLLSRAATQASQDNLDPLAHAVWQDSLIALEQGRRQSQRESAHGASYS